MANKKISGMDQAQVGYVDRTDELAIQKAGQTALERIAMSDLFGGWSDLTPFQFEIGSGPNAPAFVSIQGDDYGWDFSIGDEMWMFYHVNHNILPASVDAAAKMFLHVHWQTNNGHTGAPRWQLDYTMAHGHNTANYPAMSQMFLQEAAQGSAYRHMITEDATGVATPDIDTIIKVHIKRVASTGTENTDNVFMDGVDWHIPTMLAASKGRAYPFY